jgi:hypothetical protein
MPELPKDQELKFGDVQNVLGVIAKQEFIYWVQILFIILKRSITMI